MWRFHRLFVGDLISTVSYFLTLRLVNGFSLYYNKDNTLTGCRSLAYKSFAYHPRGREFELRSCRPLPTWDVTRGSDCSFAYSTAFRREDHGPFRYDRISRGPVIQWVLYVKYSSLPKIWMKFYMTFLVLIVLDYGISNRIVDLELHVRYSTQKSPKWLFLLGEITTILIRKSIIYISHNHPIIDKGHNSMQCNKRRSSPHEVTRCTGCNRYDNTVWSPLIH
jgi:hypothetical protein